MRKILLIRNAYNFDFGGGERLPVDIAVELKKYGFKPVVVSRSPKLLAYAQSKKIQHIKGWWWSQQDWSGKRIIFIPIYFVWQFVVFLWYCRLILRTQSDIIHVQSRDDFIAATLAAKFLAKQVLWSDYADLKYIYQNNQIWYKNPIGKLVFKVSKHANTVILTSKSDKQLIEESLGLPAPSNHRVVYMGISSKEIIPIGRSAADKDKIIFGATSRLVTTKGIGELIGAFDNVNLKHPNTRLWLFGEGPEEEHFKSMAKSNHNIVFWGYPEDSLRRLASCDVFVHPSYLEGFSLSLVEAAKLGLPLIACRVGGNTELIKDNENGFLIPEKDAKALADAMEKLLEDPALRRAFGDSARQTYRENFVFEDIIKRKLVPLYES